MRSVHMAPELTTERWFNSDQPITLSALRGRPVLLYAFQMRCPGCVQYTIPQAKEVHASYDAAHLAVVGLHTVFEDHATMTPDALAGFIAEHDLRFPIGVDAPSGASIPRTMRAYDMQGTPTIVLVDAAGRRRMQHFGHLSDLQLAGAIATLVREARAGVSTDEEGDR